MCSLCVHLCVKPQNKTEHKGARKGGGKETEITGIDFLTFSVGEKAGRDLPGGERARENVVRKQ